MDPTQTNTPTTDTLSPNSERKQSPPAFLDLADSAARLGTNMPDASARLELKRLEHERQRLLQRKQFEDQMRALEQQQAQELLSIPYDPNSNGNATYIAASAPTTPPRINAPLNGDASSTLRSALSNSANSDKRKSVTVNLSPDLALGNGHSFMRNAGAKSMPASRRTSASSHDEDLAGHLQNLALIGENGNHGATNSPTHLISSSILGRTNGRYRDGQGPMLGNNYNAGMMLDEQLDQEMHNAMLNLPTSDENGYSGSFPKNSNSSAALDLAHISQTSPRSSFARAADAREKASEWPQYTGPPRGPDGLASRSSERRTVTNPTLSLGDISSGMISVPVSGTTTPLVQHHSPLHTAFPTSRRGSPTSLLESLSSATRSVPATPLGVPSGAPHLMKAPGTPLGSQSGKDQPPLTRLASSQYDSYNTSALDETLQYGIDPVYGLDNGYGYDDDSRHSSQLNSTTGSTALYHHNGTRYGLSMAARNSASPSGEAKMNGLHGPKHKRGDMEREFNRFAGTRLEDLQGEIPMLCKDQHGCRYLQKKLEEGNNEYRDMIFLETFGHFADLMTDPFGNYLCQKLLEYSTDEQRSVICESVAQDLVNISLNMHGTRAVQKMIDFLSGRRQSDLRYNSQIHSIIVALSMHVVVLIKDLNGNHVIQKCLNKLAPEDNQFIYNAVAANCVEVATHRHGCCVLQRCIDHASDHQRVQLVNEITYNALTLVQDPYGNYVVQYILDLNDHRFSDAVIRQFAGNVCALSVQKFSSNVIEKCVRVAETSTRKMLIEELLNRSRLEKLLRDSYGNYCVQTALDYADPTQRALLVEGIRPVLPLIRNTPYGKRIQNKLQREPQGDPFGGYHNQQGLVGMGLGGQSMGMSPHAGGRHMSPALHQSHVNDIYGGQNGMYGLQQQGGNMYTQAHLTPALQHQSIDSYVLQSNSNHTQPHGAFGNAFSGAFTNNAALGASMPDPYQRTSFGYGM